LRAELEKAFDLVTRQPEIGPLAPNVPAPGVRRFHLSRVHYHLYYYYRPKEDEVEILAMWHVARGSDPEI